MEERESPARDGKDEPPLNFSPYVPFPLPVAPGMSDGSETYVVHFPRDQVYRIPPPENARIVESHRPKNNQKISGGCSGCRLIFVPLILVALAIFIFVATVLILYNPKSPEFSIKNFHAKNISSSHSKHTYSISLQIENPNKRMDVDYGKGTMFLKFKGKVIASGKYSSMKQEAAKEIEIVKTLSGTKTYLPSSMEKSLNDKHAKPMILTIKVPIKITSWVKNSEKKLTVTCHFKVKTLAKKGTKILSQECRTDM